MAPTKGEKLGLSRKISPERHLREQAMKEAVIKLPKSNYSNRWGQTSSLVLPVRPKREKTRQKT